MLWWSSIPCHGKKKKKFFWCSHHSPSFKIMFLFEGKVITFYQRIVFWLALLSDKFFRFIFFFADCFSSFSTAPQTNWPAGGGEPKAEGVANVWRDGGKATACEQFAWRRPWNGPRRSARLVERARKFVHTLLSYQYSLVFFHVLFCSFWREEKLGHGKNGAHAHYVIGSKVQWKPFWHATKLYPQNELAA